MDIKETIIYRLYWQRRDSFEVEEGEIRDIQEWQAKKVAGKPFRVDIKKLRKWCTEKKLHVECIKKSREGSTFLFTRLEKDT